MDTNIIEVKNLTKKYQDADHEVIALDNISFKLPLGFDLAVLGPSGSGKTTLLQLMSGLDVMSEGDVIINGKNIKKMNDREISEFRNKTMGFIFQMMNLQDYFSAKENIMLPMLIANISKKDAEEKAVQLLKKVGLSHRENHRPSQLSGGEQQRIAVARALANDPKIIFADEPTGKLDKENSKIVIDLLESLSHQTGMSVVMITHDENIAKRFSRVIKLENGKVVKDLNLDK